MLDSAICLSTESTEYTEIDYYDLSDTCRKELLLLKGKQLQLLGKVFQAALKFLASVAFTTTPRMETRKYVIKYYK